jgi:cell division topological specificity factor
MFENVGKMFKKMVKQEPIEEVESKEAAKERLQLVLMQDRANVSADFLELMKQEIIDVIKKYIEVDENAIDVRLTTQVNSDGTNGAPLLYANIPILNIKNEAKADKNRELESKLEKAVESVEKTTPEVATDEINKEENVLIDEVILKELNGEEDQKEEIIQDEQEATADILKDIDELYYDDEDDDDVTFDDLLKAAEEADAENSEVSNTIADLEKSTTINETEEAQKIINDEVEKIQENINNKVEESEQNKEIDHEEQTDEQSSEKEEEEKEEEQNEQSSEEVKKAVKKNTTKKSSSKAKSKTKKISSKSKK